MIKNLLAMAAVAAALGLPALAYAQTATVTSNPTSGSSASATSRNTPSSTAVGGVLYAIATDCSTSTYTPSVSDASGNTWTLIEGPAAGSSCSHSWMWRAPVTTAAGSAEAVTLSGLGSSNSPPYPSLVVVYVAPISGYTLSGVDCHNHASADSGTLSAACTTTQANDVLIGGGNLNASGAASGTTLLQNDTTSTGAFSGYNQPSTSGSHSVGFPVSAADNSLVMLAEKVTSSSSQSFSSTSISCGSSCTAAHGTGGTVGTLSAVMSPSTPAFSGTWSLKTSGTVSSKTCDTNGSSWWSISGSTLSVSSSVAAGTYHICYEATESGVSNSPFDNEVDVVVSNGISQCGSSVTPAVSGGKYVLQCQLSANLTINNPTGMTSGGGDSFLFQIMQPDSEPGTAYTVTLGTAYNQSGAPSTNTLSGLSTTTDEVDDFFGVSMPTFTNVWSAQRVEIGAALPNMGN